MLEVPVYNPDGKKIDTVEVDEALFGSVVNAPLLKQAIVAYHANKRQGSARTKSRGMVKGSTKKLFRQKGTGGARRGAIRTNVMRGGVVAFAKTRDSFRKKLPRKMRQAALDSALLAKFVGGDVMVVDGLAVDEPSTRSIVSMMKNLGINRSCIFALAERDKNIYLSSRNIGDMTVRIVQELNAFDIATRQKMLMTKQALETLVGQEAGA
ncbi:MAG TPA: 50S ribosomal protein L4 [Phycisphaerae bacterium]|nr:50S ribosomal protein L4 [Phycisphaerae bacterium]